MVYLSDEFTYGRRKSVQLQFYGIQIHWFSRQSYTVCSFDIWHGLFSLCNRYVCNYKLLNQSSLLYSVTFSYTVVVLQLVSSSAEPELKYQTIMHGVKDYINKKKIPAKLKDRLLHFYEHRFQGSLFKEKAITSTLSSTQIIIYCFSNDW